MDVGVEWMGVGEDGEVISVCVRVVGCVGDGQE